MTSTPTPTPPRTRPSARTTIRHVAAEAGVSIATVSGVLSQRPDCRASPATRTRVLAAIERLNYRPSRMAHALHGKATMTVGLVVPAIDVAEILIRIMAGFESAVRERDYMVVTACTQNSQKIEERALSEMLDRHVDAMAVYPVEEGDHPTLRRLAADGFPVVTFDAVGRLDFPVSDVSIDQFQGGYLQAKHLVEVGCRRIGIVNSLARCYVNDLKTAGIEAGLKEAGLKPVFRTDFTGQPSRHPYGEEVVAQEIREILKAHRGEVDGLAALGDVWALAAMRAALELGLRVPEDLAVVGFNDIHVAPLVWPSLTTIHDPAEELGTGAFELLLDRMTGKDPAEHRHIKLAPEIRVRGSTARAARDAN